MQSSLVIFYYQTFLFMMKSKKLEFIFLVYITLLIANVYSEAGNNTASNISSARALTSSVPCTMTKTKCFGVILACLNYRCEFSTQCNNFCCEKTCKSWYVCGACFGLPFG